MGNLKPFRAGKSGNPGGRPKGSSFTAHLNKIAAEEQAKGVSKSEAMARAVVKKALAGDIRAAEFFADRTEGKIRQGLDHSFDLAIANDFVDQLLVVMRRALPDFCPACKTALSLKADIAKLLLEESSKLMKSVAESSSAIVAASDEKREDVGA